MYANLLLVRNKLIKSGMHDKFVFLQYDAELRFAINP